MKRNNEIVTFNDREEEPKNRKLQQNNNPNNNSLIIKILNKDELFCILEFLTNKEILYLSFTNKELFQLISLIFQEIHPFIYFNLFSNNKNKEWNLSHALNEINYFVFNNKIIFNNFIKYITKTNEINDLSKISYKFIFYITTNFGKQDISFNNLFDLFNITINKPQNKTSVNCIKCDMQNNLGVINNTKHESLLIDNLLSFTIKCLDLTISCSQIQLYTILSKFYNLEKLKINLLELNIGENDNTILINPVLKKLKRLEINNDYLKYDWNIFDHLFLLCPNL
ncbi:hypothetical protein ABK040_015975 [Willaertia magna]